jgi:hypothetical protein
MKIDPRIYLSRADGLGLEAEGLGEALRNAASGARRIDILSGYYGTEYLMGLLTSIRKKRDRAACRVRLVFGVDSLSALAMAADRLTTLREQLVQKDFKEPEIGLFGKDAPFHTKLYSFLHGNQPIWFLGSANVSPAIEGARHELMIRLLGRHDALKAYVGAVVDQAIRIGEPLPERRTAAHDARAFFLDGRLCYRPTYRPTFTFEACKMNAEQRKLLRQALGQIAHAKLQTEGFGFGLASAVSGRQEEDFGTEDAETDGTATLERLNIRHLAIETSLGYWLPEPYALQVQYKLHENEKHHRERLAEFYAAITKMSDEAITAELRMHLADLTKFFHHHHLPVTVRKDIADSFARFLAARRSWLGDPERRDRMARRLVLTPMPDIWNDETASKDFELSWCEDVGFRAAITGARSRQIITVLISKLGLDHRRGLTPDDILTRLRKHLSKPGWDRHAWGVA